MSTAAGIAAVTAVLKDLLLNGLVDHDATQVVGNVLVTAQAPDRIALPEQNSQLNLFLYLVTPNPGWRNMGLPARDAAGQLVSAPPLAVDLHYLLSAYGTKDFHAEALLGYAMQLFHETPVLTRAAIRQAFASGLDIDGQAGAQGRIPVELQNLFQAGLADQIEQIKITPTYLSTEEMFKLWMAFQTPYRPTAAYHISVVLIDSKRQGRAAPPVNELRLSAVPFAPPFIQQILSQTAVDQPFLANQRILPGNRLAITGRNLQGAITRVFVGDREVPSGQLNVDAVRIEFPLPTGLLAGVQSVRVAQQIEIGTPPTPHNVVESNAAAFVLSPRLSNVLAGVTMGAGDPPDQPRGGNLTADITPPVSKQQRVYLLLNEFDPPPTRSARACRFVCTSHNQPNSPETSSSLSVAFTGVLPARYLVRVQVDGGESPLDTEANGKFNAPQVDVP